MKYIHDYFLKESILLEYDKIIVKPGLRALAKSMLNSFWGKLWKRLYLPKTQYITEPVNYFDLLTSDEQNVLGVGLVNDEMMRLTTMNLCKTPEERTLSSQSTQQHKIDSNSILTWKNLTDVYFMPTLTQSYLPQNPENRTQNWVTNFGI